MVALLCASGLVTSFRLGWTDGSVLPSGVGYQGGFDAGWEHMLNQPAYFTFLSALMVCVTSGMLAVRTHRTSVAFQALRLCAVVSVVITGLVFNLLLREEDPLTGVWFYNDTVMHIVVPVLAPLVWLIVDPRGRLSRRSLTLSTAVPIAWLIFTLGRGAFLDWYPYDILDVPGMGYAGVGVYIAAILAFYLMLAGLLWALDWVLGRGRRRRRGPVVGA